VYKIANRRADTGLTMFASQARAMFAARGQADSKIQAVTKGVLGTIHEYVNKYGNDTAVTAVLGQENVTGSLEGYEIRYVLGELERWKCKQAREKPLGWAELEKASMEHILPQYPAGAAQWTSTEWLQHNRIVNNFGNLTLTFWNSQLSNKSFSEKKVQYAESNLRIQRELGSCQAWQEGEINGRRDELIDFVLHRWSVPTL
jgi:hypothetical protein